jgi:hypothetical protein
MLFLIESDIYSAHIAAHGFKREDFAPKFREEALRALSGMCPRVFTPDEEHEVPFSSSWLVERLDLLEQMMLNGNDEFLFKYGNSGSYRLKVQEYKI